MANAITLFRILLCLAIAGLLFWHDDFIYALCFALTLLVIVLDGLDGYVARKFNEVSKLGSVLDILGDRIVEQVYWLVFLALGWIPLWIPMVVIVRGITVDGIRSIALEQGYTAFGEQTMMTSGLGQFLVSSRFSRLTYGVAKAVVFSCMILIHSPTPVFVEPVQSAMVMLAEVSLYTAVLFCILRGIPVLIEGKRFLAQPSA